MMRLARVTRISLMSRSSRSLRSGVSRKVGAAFSLLYLSDFQTLLGRGKCSQAEELLVGL